MPGRVHLGVDASMENSRWASQGRGSLIQLRMRMKREPVVNQFNYSSVAFPLTFVESNGIRLITRGTLAIQQCYRNHHPSLAVVSAFSLYSLV
jgi:hypothetical protein